MEQIHQDPDDPADKHGNSHIQYDGLINHLVEDEEQDQRNNRQERVVPGKVFSLGGFCLNHFRIGFDKNAGRGVLLIEIALYENVKHRHGDDRRDCDRKLVLDQVAHRIDTGGIRGKNRNRGRRRVAHNENRADHCGRGNA